MQGTGYRNGLVETTTKTKGKYHQKWRSYFQPMEVDPLLAKGTPNSTTKVLTITGLAIRVKTGYYTQGRHVAAGTNFFGTPSH